MNSLHHRRIPFLFVQEMVTIGVKLLEESGASWCTLLVQIPSLRGHIRNGLVVTQRSLWFGVIEYLEYHLFGALCGRLFRFSNGYRLGCLASYLRGFLGELLLLLC